LPGEQGIVFVGLRRGAAFVTPVRDQSPPKKSLFASPGVWLGILVSLICLWLAFRKVPFSSLGDALAHAAYWWLLPAVVLHLIAVWARAARWEALLDTRGILGNAFWAQGVGFLFTNAFPLRMGEPARVLALSGSAHLPVMRVAASAVVERILDVATILGMLALALPWMDVPDVVLRAGQLFAAVLVAGVVVLWLLVRYRGWTEGVLLRLFNKLHLPADSLLRHWREVVDGLRPLGRPAIAARSLLWSIVVWGAYVGYYWCVLHAFRPDPTLVEAAFIVVALAIAIAVPSSPGFIGVYQLAGQQALSLPFGARYDPGTALAVTLVSHVVYFILTSVLGAIGLAKTGATFTELLWKLRARTSGSTEALPLPSENQPRPYEDKPDEETRRPM
jgi:uncharacterized protein (TIRG00374 family)